MFNIENQESDTEKTDSKRIKLSVPVLINNNQTTQKETEDINESKIKISNNSIITNMSEEDLKKVGYDEIEDMLKCTICSDIMYNCISIRPCLHTFCGVCLLEWMQSGDDCPMCRGEIEGTSKNHLLTNIIDKYLEKHPDKMRPQNDREEADLKVLNGKDKLFFNKSLTSNAGYSIQLPLNNCPYCQYPNVQNFSFNSLDISDAPLSQYNCGSLEQHGQCQCCNIHIPLLNTSDAYPNNKCRICNKIFCFLLLGNCRNCTHGCLHIFKDFVFNPNLNSTNQVPQFLSENFYETNVLRNYLNSQNFTVIDMFKECIDSLSRGDLNIEHNINDNDALCLDCSHQVVLDMVYEYFRKIPRSCLPQHVRSRPDCYYGRHCRTQRTRQHHAINYNHQQRC